MSTLKDLRQRAMTLARRLRCAAPQEDVCVDTRSIRSRVWAFLRNGEEGQSIVEFSLTIAFLAAPIIVGMFVFSLLMTDYALLANAVSIGGRQIANQVGVTTDPCSIGSTAITKALPNFTGTFTFDYSLNGYDPGNVTTCALSSTQITNYYGTGMPLTVTAKYTVSIIGWSFPLTATVTEYGQ